MVYTAETSQLTFQSKLEIVDMKDSLLFSFINTGADGKQVTEKYAMYIYDNGNKLRFDSNEFEIVAIRRRGVRLTIIIEREGVDKYRSAEFQDTIIIGPVNLNIEKKIRYADAVDYFIRSRISLTKKYTMPALLITHIRQLVNVREQNELLRGAALAQLPVINDAFVLIENGTIAE